MPTRLSTETSVQARLRELYGDSSTEAAAQSDQVLAADGRSIRPPRRKANHKAGFCDDCSSDAFLTYAHGHKSESLPNNVTERKFRSYWERTEGSNERQRFAEPLYYSVPLRFCECLRGSNPLSAKQAMKRVGQTGADMKDSTRGRRWDSGAQPVA